MNDYTLTTTISQHVGTHKTGRHVTKYTEVTTRYSDLANDGRRWDDLTDDDRQWWIDIIDSIHAAEVELARLDADHRDEAAVYLARLGYADLEYHADQIREAIAETDTEKRD